MDPSNSCGYCGAVEAEGWAWINDDRYCHGDSDADVTCYMLAQYQEGESERIDAGRLAGIIEGEKEA